MLVLSAGFVGLRQALCWFILLNVCLCQEMCNRRPYETKSNPLPADNLFAIEIVGVDEEYIPNKNYTVKLYSRDEKISFTAFSLFATGDTKVNENNPRKPILLKTGRIVSSTDTSTNDTVIKRGCNNTLGETDRRPKTSVEAMWIAPHKENKCITIHAYVAIKPDVWYNSEGPLSKRVCEDRRKIEDMPPMENDNCSVCEEARYELKFEGSWSYNTHPKMFPLTQELARFSDVIGASHNKNYDLFKLKYDAGNGLKQLAEQGNTTTLEEEILKQLNSNVRTLIKATSPPKPNMTAIASFRVSKDKHLISLVAAIMPSPDWFVGVSNLELCAADNKGWTQNVRLNLYPLDAGTDTGTSFEAANDNTSPAKPISSAIIDPEANPEDIKPFAKLRVELVRTYSTPECTAEVEQTLTDSGDGDEGDETDEQEQPTQPTRINEVPVVTDPSTTGLDCPLTAWQEWLPCEGQCVDGKINGYRTRFRYPVAIGRNRLDEDKSYPPGCFKYSTSDSQTCEETCVEPTEEPQAEADVVESPAERRVWRDTIRPGDNWG